MDHQKGVKTHELSDINTENSFLEDSPVHGFGRITRSKSTCVQAFYIACVSGAAVLTIVGIAFTIKDVMKDPKITSTSVELNGARDYPAVTLCNLNPVRASKFSSSPTDASQPTDGREILLDTMPEGHQLPNRRKREVSKEIFTFLEELNRRRFEKDLKGRKISDTDEFEQVLASFTSSQLMESRFKRRNSQHRQKRYLEPGEEVSENARNIQDSSLTHRDAFYIYHYSNQFSRQERRSRGHQLSHMLLSCSFNGISCSYKDFSSFLDPLLGNCYTFRPERIKRTSHDYFPRTGAGLEIEVNIELQEYLHGLAEPAGLKVVVGSKDKPVLTTGSQSTTVSPGFDTYLNIAVEEFRNSDGEGESCFESIGKTDLFLGLYARSYGQIYSREACFAACEQMQSIQSCSCCLYSHPCPRGRHLCTERDSRCLIQQLASIKEQVGEDACSNHCKRECRYRKYTISTHAGKWPRRGDEAEIREKMESVYLESEISADESVTTTEASTSSSLEGIPSRRRRSERFGQYDSKSNVTSTKANPQRRLRRSENDVLDRAEADGDWSETTIPISDTALKLHVRTNFDLIVHETRSWMAWYRVLSEIGGHLALWAGLSVIALIHAGHALCCLLQAAIIKRFSTNKIIPMK
ncbi:neurogenic locus notch protein [Plakobranchus ocellatus]|uniref:Neurogenic locus notch protein n=1 Tax=Plakobranchus ocellatus TaxID=259542 RepID=A0AAV3XUZ7_9GAST|nr:neurogenic locus notch protein [Plakobranchus ocellatus]